MKVTIFVLVLILRSEFIPGFISRTKFWLFITFVGIGYVYIRKA
jgi:hypothetical protein